ncbi:DMT family transporter [Arthrobacter sp. I2-34]|uniref:DMT family transporter n=1 Tax=Arthrobacter hankyongi TaxID=2904801 RepID=A0ABS9L9D2_9MICC|nr:DMT family transporter [Arthrobacter hankyongi]MCG2623284.1 DMT family transporter [Arthrobacter hankyongi]
MPESRSIIRVPAAVAVVLAMGGGVALAVQGKLNSELGLALHDRIGAALVSFATGFAAILLFALAVPAARARLRGAGQVFRQRSYPRWYLLAGAVGAFYVFSQTAAVGAVGLSLFTIAIVTGQMISGLLVDRLGLGAGRRIDVSPVRVGAAALALAAAATAAVPHFDAGGAHGLLAVLMILPLVAGLLQSVQQGMLGRIATVHGSPVISTLLNFGTGVVLLLAIWLIQAAASGRTGLATPQWWLYLGGPLGTLVLGAATICTASLGVLVMILAVTGGQLAGSVVLDLLWPSAGSSVDAATLAGIGLTWLALLLAARPWGSRKAG